MKFGTEDGTSRGDIGSEAMEFCDNDGGARHGVVGTAGRTPDGGKGGRYSSPPSSLEQLSNESVGSLIS